MENMRTLGLLDSNGKPLAERIQRALTGLLPKVRRQFPTLQDDLALTEVVEEAGRRIASREERGGPIEQLHAYAWVTLRSVATSHVRKPSNRLIRDTVGSKAGEIHLAAVQASHGSPSRSSATSCSARRWRRSKKKSAWCACGRRLDFGAGDREVSESFCGCRRYTVLACQTKIPQALGYTSADGHGRAEPKGMNGSPHDLDWWRGPDGDI